MPVPYRTDEGSWSTTVRCAFVYVPVRFFSRQGALMIFWGRVVNYENSPSRSIFLTPRCAASMRYLAIFTGLLTCQCQNYIIIGITHVWRVQYLQYWLLGAKGLRHKTRPKASFCVFILLPPEANTFGIELSRHALSLY